MQRFSNNQVSHDLKILTAPIMISAATPSSIQWNLSFLSYSTTCSTFSYALFPYPTTFCPTYFSYYLTSFTNRLFYSGYLLTSVATLFLSAAETLEADILLSESFLFFYSALSTRGGRGSNLSSGLTIFLDEF